MEKKYYVYILLDPRYDNQPFYIGKGCGKRATTHLNETKENTENILKFNKIQKIRKDGLEPIVEYHTTDMLENDAYELETQLIQKYGRIVDGGILTNICIDNRPPHSPETHKKISETLTGRINGPPSEETKKKIGAAQRGELNHRYGFSWSDDEKQKRSEFNKLHNIKPPVRRGPMSQEQKDAIAAGNRGKKRTPEQSAYLSSIRKGKPRGPTSEATKEKIRLGNNPNTITLQIGMKFGLWTVLKKSDKTNPNVRGSQGIYWTCQCSCPKQTIKDTNQRNLVEGTSTSCGCTRGKKKMSNAKG